MDINSKETFHKALDALIDNHKVKPTTICVCESYRQYDEKLFWWGEYRNCFVKYYPVYFAEGKMAIN